MQFILHAVSNDLKVWEKHYETAFSAPKGIFEPHDWRDPFVFYQEESGEYYMLLAARLKGQSFRRSGCVALCRSGSPEKFSIPRECTIPMNVRICSGREIGGIYYIPPLQPGLPLITEKGKVCRGRGRFLEMIYWMQGGFML